VTITALLLARQFAGILQIAEARWGFATAGVHGFRIFKIRS